MGSHRESFPFKTRTDKAKDPKLREFPDEAFPPRADPWVPQSLHRCAVMGSGHTSKCGSDWGPTIDQSYSAVFRSNMGDSVKGKFPCQVGTRTDFHLNRLGGKS